MSEHDGRVRLTAVGQSTPTARSPSMGVNAAGMLLIALKQLNAGGASREAIRPAGRQGWACEYDGTELGIKP